MHLYKFKGENKETLYIGKAIDIIQRLANHNHLPKDCYEKTKYIEIAKVNSYDDMDLAERYLIAKENPVFNNKHSNKCITFDIPFIDNLKFEKYNSDILKEKIKEDCIAKSEIEKSIINFLEKVSIFKAKNKWGKEYTVNVYDWNKIDVFLSENNIDTEAYSEDVRTIKGIEYKVITLRPYLKTRNIVIHKLLNEDNWNYFEVEI